MEYDETTLRNMGQAAIRNLNISLGYICHDQRTRQMIIQDIEYLISVKIALHEIRTTESKDGI